MLFTLYLVCSASLIWNVGAQRSNAFGFGQYSSNFDFNSLFFGNYNGYSQDGGGNDYSEPSNSYSGASSTNTQRPTTNNAFAVNNGVSNNKLSTRSSQQQAYQGKPAPQSQVFSQNSKSQQQNFQTSTQYSQNSYQQSQQQNAQTQQQSYQQNTQPQQQYNKNVQAQQQLHQQNSQAQQQLYQQNLQPQQQTYQQNGQPQQQSYQQNGQPQIQSYQQNGQPQQQTFQQNGQPQQQSYQQNQNFAGNNGGFPNNRNSQNPTANVLTTKFGDSTRTGKPNQNANYNNATFAITRFGLKMFKAMNRDYQNIVASPYSVAALLALVQQGANGETQQEITQLLQLTPESSANLFQSLITFIKKRPSNNVLKIGSNVFLAREFEIDPKFKSAALNIFGSDVSLVNFNNPYNAAQQINSWVARQTNQKILNLLSPEAIPQDSLTMLVNAVYFKGVWDKKFDPKMTTRKEFTLSDGTKKPALFMESRQIFQVDIDPVIKSQVLLMPFEGTQYTMMIILPLEGVYATDVLASLTEPQLYSYQTLSKKEVKVEIPKFNIKKDSDMSYILNLLGLWKIFSPEVDLSGMVKRGRQSPRISSGLHSAVLSIDEQGSTAAAATVFSVVALSYDDSTTSFVANRPFIAILWDKELSMPLFMAKIEDPMQ